MGSDLTTGREIGKRGSISQASHSVWLGSCTLDVRIDGQRGNPKLSGGTYRFFGKGGWGRKVLTWCPTADVTCRSLLINWLTCLSFECRAISTSLRVVDSFIPENNCRIGETRWRGEISRKCRRDLGVCATLQPSHSTIAPT